MTDIYSGTGIFSEHKIGRVDDYGNVYNGTGIFNETKVGRIDGSQKRNAAAALLLLLM